MTPDWDPLDKELAKWRVEGMSLPMWWRDDDAISVTPQLERLSETAQRLGLPVHLAIIPRNADTKLADYVAQNPFLIPVVHGWGHTNHAPAGEKKSEFRLHRPMETVEDDARAGLDRLKSLFGADLRPMFVPPWNRIAPEVAVRLSDIGYRVLSTATPRKTTQTTPRLEQVNTHLDPIDWRGTRGLVSPEDLVTQTTKLLRDRRKGRTDATEPLGILTHHLVHDDPIWTFTETLLQKLLDGPSQIWTAPRTNDRSS